MEVKGEESWKSEDNLKMALGLSSDTEKDQSWDRLTPAPRLRC